MGPRASSVEIYLFHILTMLRGFDIVAPSLRTARGICNVFSATRTSTNKLILAIMIPVTSQPFAINSPAVAAYEPLEDDEKGYHHTHAHHQYAQQLDGEPCARHRCRCDNKARLRRIAAGALLAVTSFLLFLVLLALYDTYFNAGAWMGSLGLAEDGTGSAWDAVSGLVKRQSTGTTSASSDNTFVSHKRASSPSIL